MFRKYSFMIHSSLMVRIMFNLADQIGAIQSKDLSDAPDLLLVLVCVARNHRAHRFLMK